MATFRYLVTELEAAVALTGRIIVVRRSTSGIDRIEAELASAGAWLRQRRAKREFGENPNEAEVRREGVVEGYRQ